MPREASVPDPLEQSEALDIFHRRIGAAGLKSTKQRDAIVEAFFELNRHISVEEVAVDHPKIGYATVYRTLKVLVENGLAKPRDFGDGITRFDPMLEKDLHHDHLICVDCREVFEFRDEELDRRQDEVARRMGSFTVKVRKLEIHATCDDPDCPRRPK